MESKTFIKFDVTPESEKRYTMKSKAFKEAIKSGAIKIYKILNIEQRWIMGGEKYTGRIRKTIDSTPTNKDKTPKFEHTIKHHIAKGMDYEITTDIEAHDYKILGNLYKDKLPQSKLRVYVVDQSGNYDKYTITVDFPEDQPEICWVEFETNTSNVEKDGFKKPDWVKEVEE